MGEPRRAARSPVAPPAASAPWLAPGFRLPPLPAELAAAVSLRRDGLTLASADVDPADHDAFSAAAADPGAAPYLCFGPGGHGVNHRALFYQLVLPAVAVFARIPFGNVYADPEAERAAAREVLDRIEALVAGVEAAAARGRLAAGARVVVVHDPVLGSRGGVGRTRRNPAALADAVAAFAGAPLPGRRGR